jgi:hypothetical protein
MRIELRAARKQLADPPGSPRGNPSGSLIANRQAQVAHIGFRTDRAEREYNGLAPVHRYVRMLPTGEEAI